jgi:predicted RNase H-like nuclease (RuvC/YqgF family)
LDIKQALQSSQKRNDQELKKFINEMNEKIQYLEADLDTMDETVEVTGAINKGSQGKSQTIQCYQTRIRKTRWFHC